MPDVPEGWRPRPARVWQSGKKKWDQAERDKDIVPHVTRDRVQMTADQVSVQPVMGHSVSLNRCLLAMFN